MPQEATQQHRQHLGAESEAASIFALRDLLVPKHARRLLMTSDVTNQSFEELLVEEERPRFLRGLDEI